MNYSSRALLLIFCLTAIFAACRSSKTPDPKNFDVKTEPNLVMFGGWRSDGKSIYLAKNNRGTDGRTYFALAEPNGEPVVDDKAPPMEINFGAALRSSSSNSTGRAASISEEADASHKITKAQLNISYPTKSQRASQSYDLEPIPYSIHGWSSNDSYVVFSDNRKRVFVVNTHSSGMTEIKLKNITSLNQVALAVDKLGFYVVGETSLPGIGLEYVTFNNIEHNKEQSVTVLNVPKPNMFTTFRIVMSPDQKNLALLTNTPQGGGEFHPEAENKLSVYDVKSGQMTKEYKLPSGSADLKNTLFLQGPWWRADDQAFGFDLKATLEQKTFYTIDFSNGSITNWFTSGAAPK